MDISFSEMEMALNKAQQAIGHMIANMPPLATFSVKRGKRFWDIRIEIKPEAESTPDVKEKKPSLSCLRRNQRRLRMFLERNRTTGSGEPDLSGIKGPALENSLLQKGWIKPPGPVTKLNGPALSTLKTSEDVNY